VKHQLDHQVRKVLFGVVNPMKTTMNMSTPYMMTDEYIKPEHWTEEEAAAFRTEKAFPQVKFALVCFTEQQPHANGGGGESGRVLGFNRFHIWTGSAKNIAVWASVLKPLEKTCHPMLHVACDKFHSSVFGAPPIKRARAHKVVNLVAGEGHPALVEKRAKPQQEPGQQNLGDNQCGTIQLLSTLLSPYGRCHRHHAPVHPSYVNCCQWHYHPAAVATSIMLQFVLLMSIAANGVITLWSLPQACLYQFQEGTVNTKTSKNSKK